MTGSEVYALSPALFRPNPMPVQNKEAANQAPLRPVSDEERYQAAQRSTWISVAINIVLTIAQIVVGVVAHAQSLVADGLHSLSDLLADFLVLFANRHSTSPADFDHPYGHGRIETVASLVLGLLLSATGIGMLLAAGVRLQDMEHLPPVQSLALYTALVTLAAKEGLFRYMLAVAKRVRSPMLVANAWHARSDAASSLVVAAGIAGALWGYRFLDLLAAAVVGIMIARMGLMFAWEALQELMDKGLDQDEVNAIRQTVEATPGVIDLHDLRTRRMGHQVLVDAHVLVEARISVSEGHRIAEHARHRVIRAHPDVVDLLVHVDCEDDTVPNQEGIRQPDRPELLIRLKDLLGADAPTPEKVLLHYLGSRVEAEVFLPEGFCRDQEGLKTLQARLNHALEGNKCFSSVSINCRVAPK